MRYHLYIIAYLSMFLLPGLSHSTAKTGWTQYCGSQSTRCAASQGELCWIGSYGDGLYRINISTNEVSHFTNINSGLPSNLVSDLAPGPDNVVWIATDNGLSSFDGTTWHVFNRENTPFACNNIKSIDTDDKGALWVSSTNGLHCYQNSQWIDILNKYHGFPLDLMAGATKLTCAGSEVWLQLMNCMVCFNNSNETWEKLTEISSLNISRDGTRWYLSAKDKALAGMKGKNMELVPIPANCLYGTFFIDTSDSKWLYRNDTLYNQKTDQWLPIVIPQTFRSTSYYSFFRIDNAGYVWFSGPNCLLRYSPAQNDWIKFPIATNANSNYYNISKIIVDANNHHWALNQNGFYCFDSTNWTLYNPLSGGGYYRYMDIDKQGRLNVASYQSNNDNYLVFFSAVKKEQNVDGFWTASQCTCASGACNIVCLNPSDGSWIINSNTYSRGFRIMLIRDGKSQFLPYPKNDTTQLLAGLDVTDNGTIWAQTKDNLLLRYRNGAWENSAIDKSITIDTITGLLGASGDTLWIGTGKAGIARFDGTQWKRFETSCDAKSLIVPLYYDSKKGELWCKVLRKYQTYYEFSFKLGQAYAEDGLYLFNGTTGTHYTTVNSGIFDSYVNSVNPDQNGIWIANDYGLTFWDRTKPVTILPKNSKKGNLVKIAHRTTYHTINSLLSFHLDTPGAVTILIYNMSGQLIRTVDIGKRNAGLNQIRLSDFKTGYFAQNMFIVDVMVKR